MDTPRLRCCWLFALALAALSASAVVGAVYLPHPADQIRRDTELESGLPPKVFPKEAQPFSNKTASEVPDLLKDKLPGQPDPDSDTVDHPNVVDPGKTHQEGGMAPKVGAQNNSTDTNIQTTIVPLITNDTKVNETASAVNETKINKTLTSNGTTNNQEEEDSSQPKAGVIHTCTFPKDWMRSENNNDTIYNDWLADNDTNICSFPKDLLNQNSNGTIHICSIPKEWLRDSNYTIHNGTIPKELLAEINTTNINCVTPSDTLSDNNNGTIANGTIPRAWLRDSNDNIYIYFISGTAVSDEHVSESTSDHDIEEHTTILNNPIINTPIAPQLDNTTNITPNNNATSMPNATSIASSEIPKVKLTTDVSNVKVLTNETNNATSADNTTSIVVDINSSSTTEAIAVSHKDENKSTSTQEPVKQNTTVNIPPVVEPSKNTTTTTDDSDKNKTVQEGDKPVPSSTSTTSKPISTSTTTQASSSLPNEAENVIVDPAGMSSSSSAERLQHTEHDHSSSSGKTAFLQPTESAAILAGVFVGIALLGYVGLLVWRRVLERRYGNREMLVNEDDDFDTSDMRHFEL